MGDALAVCLMEMRDFKADFARYHPGVPSVSYMRVKDMLEHT
jgi:arabinose-5-phosphate isomerase